MEINIKSLSGEIISSIKTDSKINEFFDYEIKLLFYRQLDIFSKKYYIICENKIIFSNFYNVYFDGKINIGNNLNIVYPSFNDIYGRCILAKVKKHLRTELDYGESILKDDLLNELYEYNLLDIESFIFAIIPYNKYVYIYIPEKFINDKLFIINLLHYRKDILFMMNKYNHELLNDINFLVLIINKFKFKYCFLLPFIASSLINNKIILLNILKYDSDIEIYNYLLQNIYDNNYNSLLLDIVEILEINNPSDSNIETTPIIHELNQLSDEYKKLNYNHPLINCLCLFYMNMNINQLQSNKIIFKISGIYLRFINSLSCRNLIEYALSCNGLELGYASHYYRQNAEIVLIAVKENGISLKYALGNITDNYNIAVAAYIQNPESLAYTTRRVKQMFKDKYLKK